MAPLFLLLGSFIVFYLSNRVLLDEKFSISFMGRVSLAMVLIATGASHFSSTDIMVEMMPDILPLKREIVYFTGVCEFAAAIGLMVNPMVRATAIMLIVFFIAVLPANIAGSIKQVHLGGMEYGPVYLVFRIPLQILFIWWTYYFGIRTGLKSDQ